MGIQHGKNSSNYILEPSQGSMCLDGGFLILEIYKINKGGSI